MNFLDKFEEEEFIYQLGLELLTYKPGVGWNFRCPICGDSRKKYSKKRGYILNKKNYDHLRYYCFNCGYSSSFKNFLYDYRRDLYDEYIRKLKRQKIEQLKNKKNKNDQNKENDNEELFKNDGNEIKLNYLFKLNKKNFIKLSQLDKNHEVWNFIKQRKIPRYWINKLYFCVGKGRFKNMIIFPLYYDIEEEIMYGFQGRHYKQKKFLTFCKNNFKVFNYFQVDLTKEVFIFESIIDSMFVDNSIAILGSDVSQDILRTIKKPVFVFDNDKTGYKKMLKYINYPIVMYPDNFKYKDIGDWVKNEKISRKKIRQFLENNIIISNFSKKLRIYLKINENRWFDLENEWRKINEN